MKSLRMVLMISLVYTLSACAWLIPDPPQTLEEMTGVIQGADSFTVIADFDHDGETTHYRLEVEQDNVFVRLLQQTQENVITDFEMAMRYDDDKAVVYDRVHDIERHETVTAGSDRYNNLRTTLERFMLTDMRELDHAWFTHEGEAYVLRDVHRADLARVLEGLLEPQEADVMGATATLGEDISLHLNVTLQIDDAVVDLLIEVSAINMTTVIVPEE